jgi:hypothetical protein
VLARCGPTHADLRGSYKKTKTWREDIRDQLSEFCRLKKVSRKQSEKRRGIPHISVDTKK